MKKVTLAIFFLSACLTMYSSYGENFYWGVSYGAGYYEESEFGETQDDIVIKAMMGRHFSPYLSVDGAIMLGSAGILTSLGSEGIGLSGFQVALKAHIPFGEEWSAYAKGGYFKWDSKVRSEDFEGSETESSTDPFYGAGIIYKPWDRWFIYLEHEVFNDLGALDGRSTNFGFGMRF